MTNILQSRAIKLLSAFYHKTSQTHFLEINEEVRHAIINKKPIVALESTIITHGMPPPHNYNCALEVESIVRKEGAIPATIGILRGKITVGLTKEDIFYLSDTKSCPVKTSRRDLSYVVSNKLNGGTTVAATLILARKAGIFVFATGGIGGVHRDVEATLDISADLIELGRNPVAVICSGVKSILDIPKTLEYLETQGVFVATFGNTKDFPAFFCRTSGCLVPYNINTTDEAANIIKMHRQLELNSGLLFAVPVPEEFALDEEVANTAISAALVSAQNLGITGKQTTPFLLTRMAAITKGNSLATNIALIKNNAKIAAEIAVKLSYRDEEESISNTSSDLDSKNPPVIIGGSVVDSCATLDTAEITLDGRIHYAKFNSNAGGVGRNMCDALGKLFCKPRFISVVGDDDQGRFLLSTLPKDNSDLIQRLSEHNTAQCTVILDSNGECKCLIGDMDINKQITETMIKKFIDVIQKAPLIILDANLSVEALSMGLEMASQHNIPVFFEPTDVEISTKPFRTEYWHAIKYITPNLTELKSIARVFNISVDATSDTIEDIAAIAAKVAVHIENVIVTLGSRGVLIVRKGSASEPLFEHRKDQRIQIRHYPIINLVEQVLNVSGAGDCFASGFISSMLKNFSEECCVSVGFAAARVSLHSHNTVPSTFFDKNHACWSNRAFYVTIL